MALFIAGNLIAAFTGNYTVLLVSRVIAGLTQGPLFGIGAVVAMKLVSDKLARQAVGQMFAGLTLANVLGVTAGTWIGNTFGWNMTFLFISALGLLKAVTIAAFVPVQGREVVARASADSLAPLETAISSPALRSPPSAGSAS
ncbi:putative MFS family arabinose efflux permease [Nitrobacteraceae bacterium AZCC 2146]